MAEKVSLQTEPLHSLLQQKRAAYVSTIDDNGYPHTVPTWFDVDGDDLIFTLQSKRARVRYIQERPKGSVTIGGEVTEPDGYMFKGTFTLEEDPDHAWTARIVRRYSKTEEEALQMLNGFFANADLLLLRFTPVKVYKVH